MAAIVASCWATTNASDIRRRPTAAPPVLRGVSINGAEFGTGQNLGAHGTGGAFSNVNRGVNDGTGALAYHYPVDEDFAYLAGRGVGMARLLVRWERLQPALGGPLDETELRLLTRAIETGHAYGIKVSPALASYGAYWAHENGVGVRHAIGSADGPTVLQFADFWAQMATALGALSEMIGGYGITVEPILDPAAGRSPQRLWEVVAQAACEAISGADRRTPIAVSVYGHNLHTNPWVSHPDGPWITGVPNPIWYEAHQYFEWGAETYSVAVRAARNLGYITADNVDPLHTKALTELDHFHTWLDGATGYIGEIGWRKDESIDRWNALASTMYERYNAHGFHVTAWAAGAWWPPTEAKLIYGASDHRVLDTAHEGAAVVEAPANLTH